MGEIRRGGLLGAARYRQPSDLAYVITQHVSRTLLVKTKACDLVGQLTLGLCALSCADGC